MFADYTALERADETVAIRIWRSFVVKQHQPSAQSPSSTTVESGQMATQVKNIHESNMAMKSTLAKHLVQSNRRLDALEQLTSSVTQIEAQVEHFRQDRQRLVCREERLSPAVRIDACKQFVTQVDDRHARMGEECKCTLPVFHHTLRLCLCTNNSCFVC